MNVPNQTYDPSCGRSVSAVNWFADHGYPHRSGTRVRPLVMGEEAFAAVARELKGAQKSINMAFWGLDPGMVLIRGTYSNYDARDALGSILIERAKAGVEVKVCVWDQLFLELDLEGQERMRYSSNPTLETWRRFMLRPVCFQASRCKW